MKVTGLLFAAALAGAASLALAGAAQAGNLIQNSGFATAAPQSQVIEGAYAPDYTVFQPTTVTDWTAGGVYDLICYPGQCDNEAIVYNGFALGGPANGINNGLTPTGPGGGNYIALDGSFNGQIAQTIGGLQTGTTYTLSFYLATAQEVSTGDVTTEQIVASLGDQSFSTPTLTTPGEGFDPWQQQSFTFVYDGSGTVLSFLANGTGGPPYALINDPTLTGGAGVPEPGVWAMMLLGIAGLGAFARRRILTQQIA